MTDNINTTPLSIKTDENNKAVPLGIKSVAQGIEHFTNWNNLSNSIDEIGRFRREDSFKNNNRVTTAADGFSTNRLYRLDDTWDVNKVQIIDDLAFVAEDQYTDVEKITSSIITTNARQYYVERTLLRSSVPDVEEPPADSSPGFATWTSSGAYTGHMPFMPGSGYAAGPYSGSFTIKYIPSTNTWEISGSIPGTGGWGGDFSGSATYSACSGGSAANVDITITGTHYCTATSQNETYSGTVRLNISPGNSGDESTCSSDITINSVSFGATQYSSSGGCYITYAHSSISYNGYTDPVVGSTDSKVVFESKVKRRIGSLAARLTNSESNILQEYAFTQDEDSELLVNPTEADFSNVYIKIKSKIKTGPSGVRSSDVGAGPEDSYLRFGGFIANDFCKSNDFVRRDNSSLGSPKFKPEIFRDTITLKQAELLSGILNPLPCDDENDIVWNPPLEFTNQGLEAFDVSQGVFGDFLPPEESQLKDDFPINYSFLNAQTLPSWNSLYTGSQDGDYDLHKQLLFALGGICEEDLNGDTYSAIQLPPLNSIINPSDSSARNYDAYGGGQHVFQNVQHSDGADFRQSWKSQQEGRVAFNLSQIQPLGEDSSVSLYKRIGPTSSKFDIPREPISQSEIGRYYLMVDDSNPESPYIAGVQFDFCLNSIDGSTDTVKYYEDESGLNDFQKGLAYAEVPVEMEFIKFLPIRQCGKIDIYKRKSGKPTYVPSRGPAFFSFTNHGFLSGEIIKVSGALYKETGAAIRDTHPLNGFFKVQVVDKDSFFFLDGGREEKFNEFGMSSFTVWNNPPTRADMELLRSMDGVTFSSTETVAGASEREGEGWSYEGTIFSPTGKNGYFNRLSDVDDEDLAVNVLANENEFYTTSRIDITDITKDNDPSDRFSGTEYNPTTQERGFLSFNDPSRVGAGSVFSKDPRDKPRGDYGRGWPSNYSLLIKRLIEAVPETPQEMRISNIETFAGFSALPSSNESIKNLSLGPDQIYPYTTTSTSFTTGRKMSNYKGCRFGCDFKVEKLEDGTYTIAVGERGSDVSVNLFGMDEHPTKTIDGTVVYRNYADFGSEPSGSSSLKFRSHRRYIPEYLPYGKTHIINIALDSSNSISSVSHENSLFGGGHSIKSMMNENIISGRSEHSLEKNPWSDLEVDFRVNKGTSSFSRVSEISSDDILVSEQDFLDKTYVEDRSRYWQRHAIMHWYPQPIPEILGFREYVYGQGGYGEGEEDGSSANPSDIVNRQFGFTSRSPKPPLDWPYKRNFLGLKRSVSDGVDFADYVSVFGDDENIISVDRFNVNNDPEKAGYWSIFPWVDSFGKSVGLSIDNSLKDIGGRSDSWTNGPKMTVLSASTSRCNIDITDEVEQPIANLTKDQIKPGDGRYRIQDSESQIGQLNAHFVYKEDFTNDYDVVDYMQINSAGSMGGRYRRALSRKYKRRRVFDPSDASSIRYTQLPQGTYAGHGIAEVMTSCYMSYSDIVFDKDRIIFSEQSLGENKSIIHIFDFNASSTLPFKRNHTVERQFNFERNSAFTTDENKEFQIGLTGSSQLVPKYRKAVKILERNTFNVGDGFGMVIRVDKGLLLTNATDTIDEFGQTIRRASNQTGFNYDILEQTVQWGIDQIFLYEKFKETFEFSQKITATTTSDSILGNITSEVVSGLGWTRNLENVGGGLSGGTSAAFNFGSLYGIVPLAAMNYDNVPNGTFAWVLQLAGRYDLADTRIVLQDPHAVAIFDRDFSESEPMIGLPFARNPELTSAKIETFDHQDTSKLTYEAVTGTRTRSGVAQNFYDCRLNIEDYQKSQGKYHELPEQVPILNYDLEGDEDIYLSEMTINFDLVGAMDDISTTFTPRIQRPVTQPLVPRLVLYNRDPATIVTRNTSSKIIERDSNVSNFYTLDTSKKTKKIGGFIAPTKSASDFDNPLIEGNTYYNDVRATRTHRDAGFMGQFRGGAQDLFFYGTLVGSTPENAQEVFGGNEPRTTLPYLYGGETNLADFTGGCSWIAPDVYHKYTLDQIAQIKPYARLFNPVKQSDGRYSVTITSEDVNFRDFINKGTGGIWIGFVLTNINSFDINTSEVKFEEFSNPGSDILFYPNYLPVETYTAARVQGDITTPAPDGNIGPFRFISAASIDGATSPQRGFVKTVSNNWINARYPYCRVGVYPAQSSGKGSQTQIRKIDSRIGDVGRGSQPKSLSCFAEATVKNPEVELKGFVTTGRRYKTSFSKRAVVSLKDIFTQPTFDGDSRAVVAIGKSENTPSINLDSTVGNFSRSYQIITATDGYINDPNKTGLYPVGSNPPGLIEVNNQYDQLGLRHSNILSSFDIIKPDYLSLTINGLRAEENFATLFTPTASAPASGLASLVLAPAQEEMESVTTLFTGLRDFDGVEPLFLSNKASENKFTLNINEIQPSAVVPFFTKTVDASGGVDLAFAPPTTGSAPLFVTGPIAASGLVPLNTVGGAFMDEIFTLRVSGAFQSSGLAPLFTNSHFDASGLTTLAMNPPMTGSMPLYLNSNPVASGQATLTIFDKASGVQDVNLFIGDQFDVENNNLNLLLDGFTFPTGQAPLNTTGFALTADSNRNSSSSFLVGLPDNEFDKGDPNGDFNEDPIAKTISGQSVSSNSVLSNAVDEQFYEYNKNIINSRSFSPRLSGRDSNGFNTSSQTDPFSPHIFVNQRQGLTKYAPYHNRVGTLDPAYNLAIGAHTTARNSTIFPLSGEDSKSAPYSNILSRDYVEKYFNGNQEVFNTTAGSSFRADSIEKEFYDINEKILVTAALKGGDDMLEISIYDIDDDGNVSQRGQGGVDGIIRTSPADMVLDQNGKASNKISIGGERGDFVSDNNVIFQTNNYGSNTPLPISVSFSEGNEPYAKNISPSLIDPFTSLREDIFKLVAINMNQNLPTGQRGGPLTEAIFNGVKMDILSLKVSQNSKCAISFRVRFDYSFYNHKFRTDSSGRTVKGKGRRYKHTYTESRNFILVFDINKFNGTSGFSSEKDYKLIHRMAGASFGSANHPFNASSMSFDSQDNIYINNVEKSCVAVYKKSQDYKDTTRNAFVSHVAAAFRDSKDLAASEFFGGVDSSDYNAYKGRNIPFIKNRLLNNPSGFGHKVKIYKDYSSDGEIMAVSAPLFDPFLRGSLSTSHWINPMGAVYVYKKGKDEDIWSYHCAVYAKGGAGSPSGGFRGGTIGSAAGKPQVSLFGYDFDYSEDILSVTAPGGDGEGTVEAGKVYSFNIADNPVLTNTYSASDITFNSSPIKHGDNFGTHITCFDKSNIFVFSDTVLNSLNKVNQNFTGSRSRIVRRDTIRNEGESLLHNLANGSSFGLSSRTSSDSGSSEYNRLNDFKELQPYFTSGLKSGAYPEFSGVMQVWSRILSIKKFSTKNKDRLLVVRKFAFRLNSAEGMTEEDHYNNSFDVVKLQVIDLERSVNGTLFIKAPDSADSGSLAPLYSLAPGPSGNFDMVIKPIAYPSGLASLFVDNRSLAADIPLHIPRIDNVFLPLAASGFAPSVANEATLFMKHQIAVATPDLFMSAIGVENSGISFIAQGSLGEGVSADPSLVINRHVPGIPTASAATLFLNQTNFKTTSLFANNAGSDNPAIDLVVGSPLFASPTGSIPLSVKTFTPPVGPGGGFVGSGIISIAMSGNNDAGVYNKHNGDTSLVLAAKNITDSQNVLFIEKSFGGLSPLYMDSRIASGDVVLNVEGANIQESNINLNTRGGTALVGLAETGNFSAFTRGWFD
jgi:hypothetical protein